MHKYKVNDVLLMDYPYEVPEIERTCVVTELYEYDHYVLYYPFSGAALSHVNKSISIEEWSIKIDKPAIAVLFGTKV